MGTNFISQRGQTYIYKKSNFWGSNAQHGAFLVNNKVLSAWKSVRVDLKHSHHTHTHTHTHKELTMWGDGCVSCLDLGNHSTVYMYI